MKRYKELKIRGKIIFDKIEIESNIIENNFNWILDAEIENARLEITKNTLVWNSGIWYNGDWQYGVFRNGEFKYGIFMNGVWYDGVFQDGIFLDGLIFNGKFLKGEIKSGEIRGGKFYYTKIYSDVIRKDKYSEKNENELENEVDIKPIESQIEKKNYKDLRIFNMKYIKEYNTFSNSDDIISELSKVIDIEGYELNYSNNMDDFENTNIIKLDSGKFIKYIKNDFMKWIFYGYGSNNEEIKKILDFKILDNKIYSQEEMVKKGANYHLHHGMLMLINVDDISGLDNIPGSWSDNEGNDREFKKDDPLSIKPIEVIYDKENNTFILYDGNHRINQAKINDEKYIKAFVQADKEQYKKWLEK